MKCSVLKFIGVWLLAMSFIAPGYGQNSNPFSSEPEFLPVEQAFEAELRQGDVLTVSFNIQPGYYLYKHQFKVEPASALQQPINFPPAEAHVDEFFGETQIFRDYVEFEVHLKPDLRAQSVTLQYQGCADAGLCYPPTKLDLSEQQSQPKTNPGPATPNSDNKGDELFNLQQQPMAWSLFLFFILGIGLAFTPCVFPMYPILSSIVIGDKPRTFKNALWLSFIYVQGMAITYSLLGLLVALAGMQYQAYFQHPAVLIVLSAAFAVFALSMLGLYNIQLPGSWQTKLQAVSGKQRGGSILGVFFIGVISGLVASPCTTAPLSGALLYIAQSGDVVSGAAILYALSLGMGIPLIIFGVSGGKLLPKAGAWMNVVKHSFGWLLLAVVVVLLERLLATQQSFWLWVIYFIALTTFMGQHLMTFKKWYARALLFILLTAGSTVGMYWQVDKLQKAEQVHGLFYAVANSTELQQQLDQAQQAGEWVMLDLYADWCVACKEFEQYTFADEKVRRQLSAMRLLQADVTSNDKADQKLLNQFQVLGLPTVMFFSPGGEELREWRITGFKGADEFVRHLEQMKSAASP